MLSYHDFRESLRGRVIVDAAAKSVNEMEQLSRRGEPAIAAIDGVVADQLGRLDDLERQHAGRVIRDLLAPRGWRPKPVRKRLRQGQAFTSGAVYARAFPMQLTPSSSATPVDRFSAARAILQANRIDPDSPPDTVDAFLADRRRMWGEV